MMREEIKNLIEQSKKDLEVAGKNFKIEEYDVSAFLCQQAVEKSLKDFFALKKNKSPGATHSLIFLAKESGVPKEFFPFLGSLTPEFITTRYPDVAGDAPFRLYHQDKVEDYLIKSEEIIKWIENQIKKL